MLSVCSVDWVSVFYGPFLPRTRLEADRLMIDIFFVLLHALLCKKLFVVGGSAVSVMIVWFFVLVIVLVLW